MFKNLFNRPDLSYTSPPNDTTLERIFKDYNDRPTWKTTVLIPGELTGKIGYKFIDLPNTDKQLSPNYPSSEKINVAVARVEYYNGKEYVWRDMVFEDLSSFVIGKTSFMLKSFKESTGVIKNTLLILKHKNNETLVTEGDFFNIPDCGIFEYKG